MARVLDGPFRRRDTKHFIIYHRNEDLAGFIAKYVESALKTISADVGGLSSVESQGKTIIKVVNDDAEMARFTSKQQSVFKATYFLDSNTMFLNHERTLAEMHVNLTHETAHLAYDSTFNSDGRMPWWMREGFSEYEETKADDGSHMEYSLGFVRDRVGYFDRLDLTAIEVNTSGAQLDADYHQSATLVFFLVQQYGLRRFILLSKAVAQGAWLDEALQEVYSPNMTKQADLEQQWTQFVGRQRAPYPPPPIF